MKDRILNGGHDLGKSFCCIEPVTTAALIAGGASLLGSGMSFMGGQSQASSTRQAMERYLAELNRNRQLFLDQPEVGAIRRKLGDYISGGEGYNPQLLGEMKAGVFADYGRGLSDFKRLTAKAGAGKTGVYTPGRADRTSRLLGQNIAANRASSIRDIHAKNADVALNNQRFAISAMPTVLPGTPSTTVASPDVYAGAGATAHPGSYIGPALQNAGQMYANMSMYGPILERMMTSQMNPYFMMNMPGMNPNMTNWSPSAGPEMSQRLFPTQ